MIVSKDRLDSIGLEEQQSHLSFLLAFNTTPLASKQKSPRPWLTVISSISRDRQCLSESAQALCSSLWSRAPRTPPSPMEYSLGSRVIELVLPRAAKASLHSVVSPEPPDDTGQILRKHALLLSSAGQCKQLPGIILGMVVRRQPVTGVPPHPTCQGSPEWGPRLGYF